MPTTEFANFYMTSVSVITKHEHTPLEKWLNNGFVAVVKIHHHIWISWVLGQRQNNQWNDQYATIHTSEHRSKKRGASWLRKLMAAVSLALDEHFFFYKGDHKSRVNLHGYTSDSPCPVSYTYPHGWTMTTSSSRINPFGLAQSKGFFFFQVVKT